MSAPFRGDEIPNPKVHQLRCQYCHSARIFLEFKKIAGNKKASSGMTTA
jgi:hypothetical protein